MRIGIAFLLVSLCVPAISYSLEEFQEDSEVGGMRSDVDSIIRSADGLYFSGSGSSCRLPVHAEPGYEYWIGGEGPDAYCVSISKGDSLKEKVFAENPAILFLGDMVRVTGYAELRMECMESDGQYGVKVTVL